MISEYFSVTVLTIVRIWSWDWVKRKGTLRWMAPTIALIILKYFWNIRNEQKWTHLPNPNQNNDAGLSLWRPFRFNLLYNDYQFWLKILKNTSILYYFYFLLLLYVIKISDQLLSFPSVLIAELIIVNEFFKRVNA